MKKKRDGLYGMELDASYANDFVWISGRT